MLPHSDALVPLLQSIGHRLAVQDLWLMRPAKAEKWRYACLLSILEVMGELQVRPILYPWAKVD